jgi:hypothetical protein
VVQVSPSSTIVASLRTTLSDSPLLKAVHPSSIQSFQPQEFLTAKNPNGGGNINVILGNLTISGPNGSEKGPGLAIAQNTKTGSYFLVREGVSIEGAIKELTAPIAKLPK